MKRRLNSFSDASEYQLCCGCGVCGYLHPEKYSIVDAPAYGKRPLKRPENEGPDEDIYAVCPGLSVGHDHAVLEQSGLVEELTAAWGPVFGLWEAAAADPEMRYKGSSGGAISALSLYCLEKEGMAGVLQVSSDPEKPYMNTNVISRNRADILDAAGSRYAPASPCEDLELVEQAESACVFVGKPCDIVGANNAAKLKPKLNKNLGLTIACFCAGTPSTEGTLQMLSYMGVKDAATVKSLRYRGHGWPGQATVEYADGSETKSSGLSYAEAWGDLLQKYRQWRCYICPDHTGEFADIAVGDPWYRDIKEGEDGTSLVLARTEKGFEIIKKAIECGYLVGDKVEPVLLPRSQPNLLKARGALWGRLISLKTLGAPCPDFSNFSLFPFWLSKLSFKEKIQSFIGTYKRVFVKRLRQRHCSSTTH